MSKEKMTLKIKAKKSGFAYTAEERTRILQERVLKTASPAPQAKKFNKKKSRQDRSWLND